MFHDIFRTRKRKEPKKPIVKILADIHEKDSMIFAELQSDRQIALEIKPLKIADYLIGDIAVERKTASDFISSMINKRLIGQIKQMKSYKKQLLIIEGKYEDIYSLENSNSIRGFILSIITNHNIPVIFTSDPEDSARYLITLAKQQVKKITEPSLHSRIPKTASEQKEYILESFPNIGPKKAEQLLKKFRTLSAIFNANEKELEEVLKSRAREFKGLVDL